MTISLGLRLLSGSSPSMNSGQ